MYPRTDSYKEYIYDECLRAFVFYFQEGTTISDLMINGQIRDKEVRLIGEDGAQLGVMSAQEAQKLADEAGLDLVKIAPTAKPPVCKIVDYGKFKYERSQAFVINIFLITICSRIHILTPGNTYQYTTVPHRPQGESSHSACMVFSHLRYNTIQYL